MDRLEQLESTHHPQDDSKTNTSPPLSQATTAAITQPTTAAEGVPPATQQGPLDLAQRVELISNDADSDNKTKLDSLYKLYMETIQEEVKSVHRQIL